MKSPLKWPNQTPERKMKDIKKVCCFIKFPSIWTSKSRYHLVFFFIQAQVDGYARLFGIFEETRMLLTHDSLQVNLTTDVSKSFKINVNIITNYSSNRNDTLFNAMVVFDNGLSKVRCRAFSFCCDIQS